MCADFIAVSGGLLHGMPCAEEIELLSVYLKHLMGLLGNRNIKLLST